MLFLNGSTEITIQTYSISKSLNLILCIPFILSHQGPVLVAKRPSASLRLNTITATCPDYFGRDAVTQRCIPRVSASLR